MFLDFVNILKRHINNSPENILISVAGVQRFKDFVDTVFLVI